MVGTEFIFDALSSTAAAKAVRPATWLEPAWGMVMLATLCAMALASALVPLAARTARVMGLLDQPHPRNLTRNPTPRIGGVAIIVAALVVSLALLTLVPVPREIGDLIMFAAAAVCITALGLVDDLISVSSKMKLLILLAAAAAMCGIGVRIDGLILNTKLALNFDTYTAGIGSWVVTIAWIVTITVAFSFIDGLDGLASGIALITAGTIAIVASLTGQPDIALIAAALAGALIGFLFFNYHPASIFMGDSGSLSIGFILATLCVLIHGRVVDGRLLTPYAGTMKALVLPAAALSIPLIDAALTLTRRSIIDRRSIFAAERGHIHHRLIDNLGLKHPHATLLLWIVSLAAVVLATIALIGKGFGTVFGLMLLVPLMVTVFRSAGSVRLRETIGAIRRNRQLQRSHKSLSTTFDDMQNRFRGATDLGSWWEVVCMAAEQLNFLSVKLQLSRREGAPIDLSWSHPTLVVEDTHQTLDAMVPIPQRRDGDTARAEVVVAAGDCLETAGQRLAIFSRLMAEQGLKSIKSKRQPRAFGLSSLTGPIDLPRRKPAAISLPVMNDGPAVREKPRIAVVHDFLYVYAGAERVLEQILNVFPDAHVFSLFDFVPEGKREFLQNKPVTTTFIQRLPFAKSKHRVYLPLMPLAIEQLDLTGFDIVISSSYVAAKGIITKPSQLHICYCHSPVRYAWDLQRQYLKTSGMHFGLRSMLARWILHYLRMWDVRSANGVDQFLANSEFVSHRIKKIYRRNSTVLHPPVDTNKFALNAGPREDFYLVSSRLVPYKRIDVVVDAFQRLPDKKLIVTGDGPELERIKATAGPNVEFRGHVSQAELTGLMQRAKAFVFAAEEDFGIVMVEALSCGTPVIAFGRGGAREIVVDGMSGVLFHRQEAADVVDAVRRFETHTFDPHVVRARAEKFNIDKFRQGLGAYVDLQWEMFADQIGLRASSAPVDEIDSEAAPATPAHRDAAAS